MHQNRNKGGRPRRYASAAERSRAWRRNNPGKHAAQLRAYRRRKRERKAREAMETAKKAAAADNGDAGEAAGVPAASDDT